MAVPAIVKVTFIFGSNQAGWSESYYFPVTVTTPNIIPDLGAVVNSTPFQNFLFSRVAMLANPAFMKALRVSTESDNTGAPVLGDSYLQYVNLQGTLGGAGAESDPDLALLVLMADSPRRYRKFTFLRGFPDTLETNGGQITNNPMFQTAFSNFGFKLTALGAGWMRSAKNGLPWFLSNYAVDATTSVVTLNFTLNPFTLLQVGSRFKGRFSGVNAPAKSKLNGAQIYVPESLNSARLFKPLALGAWTNTGGALQMYTPTFQPCGVNSLGTPNVTAQKISRRKVGAPLLEARGRVRALART